MNGDIPRDPWDLESEETESNDEEASLDGNKPDAGNLEPAEAERDPWVPEHAFANIVVRNLTPQTDPKTRDKWMWQAIGHALLIFETREEIDQYVLAWNEKNDPKLDEADLRAKIDWALNHLPSKLMGTA